MWAVGMCEIGWSLTLTNNVHSDGSFCRLLDAHYHDRVKLTGIDPGDDIAMAIEQSNKAIEFLKDTFMSYADKVQEASFDMVIFTKSLHHCPDEPKIVSIDNLDG